MITGVINFFQLVYLVVYLNSKKKYILCNKIRNIFLYRYSIFLIQSCLIKFTIKLILNMSNSILNYKHKFFWTLVFLYF